jgi:hypothetical protein
MRDTRQTATTSTLERFVAMLAAVVCAIITVLLWWNVSAYQTMWPLPGVYFIEVVALSTIAAILFVRGDSGGSFITWGVAGVMSVFSILGAFSIGFFYLPVALIFAVISITWDVRNKQHLPAHLGIFFIAGLIQLILMFAAIRLLDPGNVI